jgi:hypothetical protein
MFPGECGSQTVVPEARVARPRPRPRVGCILGVVARGGRACNSSHRFRLPRAVLCAPWIEIGRGDSVKTRRSPRRNQCYGGVAKEP